MSFCFLCYNFVLVVNIFDNAIFFITQFHVSTTRINHCLPYKPQKSQRKVEPNQCNCSFKPNLFHFTSNILPNYLKLLSKLGPFCSTETSVTKAYSKQSLAVKRRKHTLDFLGFYSWGMVNIFKRSLYRPDDQPHGIILRVQWWVLTMSTVASLEKEQRQFLKTFWLKRLPTCVEKITIPNAQEELLTSFLNCKVNGIT